MNDRSLLLSLHALGWRLLETMDGISRGLWAGLWLGILNRKALHAIDETYYSNSANYPSPDHNFGGLYGWEEHVVNQYFSDCTRVVLLGAGAGREIPPLVEQGMAVDAFECHKGLRNAGNRHLEAAGQNPAIQSMERDMCPDLEGPYDGVIVGWGMYTLIHGRERRVNLLKGLRNAVGPGSPLLVSFYLLGGPRRPYRIAASLGGMIRKLLRRDPIEFGDYLSPGYGHFFSRETIEEELTRAGWRLEFFDRRTYPHAVAVAAEPT